MIFDVTKLSKVLYCENYQEYSAQVSTDSYSNYTLYLVNSTNTLIAYYGQRRLSDFLVLFNSYPSSPDLPINKLYLSVDRDSNGNLICTDVFYKYLDSFRNPQVLSLVKEGIRLYLGTDSNPNTIELVFDDNTSVTLLVVDSNGNLSDEALSEIKESATEYYIDQYSDITWSEW